MQHQQLDFPEGFRIAIDSRNAQAAVMVIAAGEAEGGPRNRHRGADQWLYVVAGEGEARVEGKAIPLRAGTLLLIERGERHEVRATGRQPLQTLNLYSPPAYDRDGEPLPAGED